MPAHRLQSTLTELRGALTPGAPGHGPTGARPLRVAAFHVLLPSPEKTGQANSALQTDGAEGRGKGSRQEGQLGDSQGSFEAPLPLLPAKVTCENWTQGVGIWEGALVPL